MLTTWRGCLWLQTYFWVHMVHFAIEATRNPTGDFKGFLVTNPQLIDGAWLWRAHRSLPDSRCLCSLLAA